MGLAFVPTVFPSDNQTTWVTHAGRLWEVTAWMPGTADFRAEPNDTRLCAACTALARLHRAWAGERRATEICPAVCQRLGCAREWAELLASGWLPSFDAEEADPVRPWAGRAWELLPARVARTLATLASWSRRPVRVQPCLCDVWHDHVLFVGDEVSGLVDYGAVKPNHVAADLARLLGSLVGEDRSRWQVGLDAYRRLCPLSEDEEKLAVLLDRTGSVLGAVNWLRWLYHERRAFADRAAVAARLAEIVLRLEKASGAG
jgi:Ser/Thr protein kinase RdoA (MazF antagonist)